MSEFKFTPGPWVTNHISSSMGKGIAIDAAHPEYGNIEICEVWGTKNTDLIDDEAQANANLIKSAPRLLNALQKLVLQTRDGMGYEYDDGEWPALDEARAAIAEALGQ